MGQRPGDRVCAARDHAHGPCHGQRRRASGFAPARNRTSGTGHARSPCPAAAPQASLRTAGRRGWSPASRRPGGLGPPARAVRNPAPRERNRSDDRRRRLRLLLQGPPGSPPGARSAGVHAADEGVRPHGRRPAGEPGHGPPRAGDLRPDPGGARGRHYGDRGQDLLGQLGL